MPGARPRGETRITDNLQQLFQVLPVDIQESLRSRFGDQELLEIVLDLGRNPEARFVTGSTDLLDRPVEQSDLEHVIAGVGEFGKDNRAGIERTLHRISAIRNRTGRIVGLTCRIGRAVFGTIDIMRDVVESGKSILILGRPGVGKTTKLREVARVLSTDLGKRVIIVDTSNEIAGDGDIPHPAIGRARRMQVPEPALQHAVMIEAVENHMPEVIVIDEIGTEQEAFAARTIAERGVQLVGTAHGNTLENLLMNPTLSDLIGGIQPVTLSDEEARRRGTQKTVLERKAPPTFDIVLEMIDKERMAIHHDVEETVDQLLRGRAPRPEIRERTAAGGIEIIQEADDGSSYGIGDWAFRPGPDGIARPTPSNDTPEEEPARLDLGKLDSPGAVVRIYPYGVSRNRMDKAIRDLRVPAILTKTWDAADAIVTLKAHYRREPGRLREAIDSRKPTFVVRSNTQVQIESIIREMFGLTHDTPEALALEEAEDAIAHVLESGEPVELSPQASPVRRLQHRLIESRNLLSVSVGTEPHRRLRIMKG